jgi:hypothetical protein
MKTYKDIISEVAEPLGGDEKRFKAKHMIQKINHPTAEDDQFTGGKTAKKDKSKKASHKEGEDEAVYEETDKEDDMCPECGESYDECECDGEEMEEAKMSDDDMKQRENIVKGMKKSKADLQARYGDKWKSVMYATATKKAMEEFELDEAVNVKGIQKAVDDGKSMDVIMTMFANKRTTNTDEIRKVVQDYKWKNRMKKEEAEEIDEAGPKMKPDFLKTQRAKDAAHNAAMGRTATGRKKPASKPMTSTQRSMASMRKEEINLDEAFKAGEMKLSDGSSVKLTNEDVSALNTLFKELNAVNQKKMQERMMKDKKGFAEIVSFAKEAL